MQSIVYNTNNITGMQKHEDLFFDLTFADPPYGIDGNGHRRNLSRNKRTLAKAYHNALWNQEKPTDEFFTELYRTSKDFIIFGANYFPQITTPHKTPRRTELQDWLKEHPTNWIVWDKCNGDVKFNDYELAYTTINTTTIVYPFMWNGMQQGLSIYQGHKMQPYKHRNEKRIHPTQKPVALYKWFLNEFAKPGYRIQDTHVGSGSSRIACFDLGFDYTGYEVDSIYYSDEEKRFNQHTSILKLQL